MDIALSQAVNRLRTYHTNVESVLDYYRDILVEVGTRGFRAHIVFEHWGIVHSLVLQRRGNSQSLQRRLVRMSKPWPCIPCLTRRQPAQLDMFTHCDTLLPTNAGRRHAGHGQRVCRH